MPPRRLDSWDDCEAATAGNASEAPTLSPADVRCCQARRVWMEIEAVGGCGGDGDPELDCRAAETLCEQCNRMGEEALLAQAAAMGAANGTRVATTAGEGTKFSSLDPAALEMRCTLPRLEAPCADSLADVALGVVLIAGLILLVATSGCAALFDRFALSRLVARLQRRLQVPVPGAGAGAGTARKPAAPPPSAAPAEPPATEPPPWKGGNPTSEALRSPCGAAGVGAAGALRCAASAPEEHRGCPAPLDDLVSAEGPPPPEMPTPGSGLGLLPRHLSSLSLAVPGGSGRWPPRLARVWALRAAFLWVATAAVVARLADALLRVALAVGSKRSLAPGQGSGSAVPAAVVAVLPELLLCVAPLAWCAWTSRPPAKPEGGIPFAAAYICRRLPRFITFAITVIGIELYSTMVAAAGVARAPCRTQPWRVILPYCVGVVVAVARAYSALLAIRLQDELAGACRKVLPMEVDAEGAAAGGSGFSSVAAPPAASYGVRAGAGFGLEEGLDAWTLEVSSTGSPGHGPQPLREGWWRPVRPPKSVEAAAERRGCCHRLFPCCRRDAPLMERADDAQVDACGQPLPQKGCRRYLGRRLVLRCSVVLVVLSATASAVIWRLTRSEAPPPALPSSCVTAQNATATCEAFQMVEQEWDSTTGVSAMAKADTLQECCTGCDQLAGCQAWMFEGLAKRCRWIAFQEDPCIRNPGDLRCRCMTHFGTAFGFKPTSPIIWIQREP